MCVLLFRHVFSAQSLRYCVVMVLGRLSFDSAPVQLDNICILSLNTHEFSRPFDCTFQSDAFDNMSGGRDKMEGIPIEIIAQIRLPPLLTCI